MLAQACAGKKTSVKAALLDQTVVAGLGNIYVCEALSRSRISPRRMASTLATRSGAPHQRTGPLVDSIKAVLADAIEAGGSSLRDHRQTSGELGYFQHRFRVYDREGNGSDARCSGTRLCRHDQPHRADRALDVLLSGARQRGYARLQRAMASRRSRPGDLRTQNDSGKPDISG